MVYWESNGHAIYRPNISKTAGYAIQQQSLITILYSLLGAARSAILAPAWLLVSVTTDNSAGYIVH